MVFPTALLLSLLLGWGYAGTVPSLDGEHEATLVRRIDTAGRQKYVWRSDDRNPETIRREGGFRPVGDYVIDGFAYDLRRHVHGSIAWLQDHPNYDDYSDADWTHVRNDNYREAFRCGWSTAYVSTSAAFQGVGNNAWVYFIRATPNMVEATTALGEERDDEREFVALGGILWSQAMTPNPEYNEARFRNSYAATSEMATGRTSWGMRYFLDRQGATSYMSLSGVGDVVGWTGSFPLIPDVVPEAPTTQAPTTQEPATCPANNHEIPYVLLDADQLPEDRTHTQQLPATGPRGQRFPVTQQQQLPATRPRTQRLPSRPPRPGRHVRWANPLVTEIDEAMARSVAALDTQQRRWQRDLAPDLVQVLRRMRIQEELGTCHLVDDCLPEDPPRRQKRALDDKKMDEICEIVRNLGRPCNPPCKAQQPTNTRKPQQPVNKLFHGSFLWPEEAKKQGGFLPQSTDPPSPTYQVAGAETAEPDFATYLLPAYQSLGIAAKHASYLAAEHTDKFEGVVYLVHATPNIIVKSNISAAVGGILWSQVMGWMQVPRGFDMPTPDQMPKNRDELKRHFQKAYEEKSHLFTLNPDYDAAKFDHLNATAFESVKIHTTEDLFDFMKTHSQAVGWTGFPLIKTTAITGSDSKKAKENKAVAPPHPEGHLDKIANFVKRHWVAIALLPVAAVLTVIPVAGEAAAAAEAAALLGEAAETVPLLAEGAEAIELTEVGGSTASSVGRGFAQAMSKVKIE
ncbi:putative enterotoxin [Ophiocordyceps camponoti-rufipedis]|uniref:Putative enterotoxin n=1 Tax=Ophiocordyceps camponoti-rufipedis TaxID=2004952 RepID=A0A2C5ZLR9_9HYPO|nr:putative enterotoxin [Ophiocordyceps camponoti-rufipedis]